MKPGFAIRLHVPTLFSNYVNGEAFEFAEDGLEDWLQEREDLADQDEDLAEYDVWETLKEYIGPSGEIVERIDRDIFTALERLS